MLLVCADINHTILQAELLRASGSRGLGPALLLSLLQWARANAVRVEALGLPTDVARRVQGK